VASEYVYSYSWQPALLLIAPTIGNPGWTAFAGPDSSADGDLTGATRGDGLRFLVDARRNLSSGCMAKEEMSTLREIGKRIIFRLPATLDSGKSTLVRDVFVGKSSNAVKSPLFSIPTGSTLRSFSAEQRGDWVLNPKDERCPYWPIGDEASVKREATPIANGLFPEEPTNCRSSS